MSAFSIGRRHDASALPALPKRLRFIRPTLPDLDSVQRHYQDAYENGLITNGAIVERFERAIAERLGVKHCIAVSSCTSGLMLVMKAFGLRGEVIVPSFTFFASGEALLWNGLKPVFAECSQDTWTVDPSDVEDRITSQTSAILGVHLYGNPCQTEALAAIAARHGLKLIFDAAHAFGSVRGRQPVGGFGDAEVFSLSPTKLLIAGEGGLVTTNDTTLAAKLRAGRNYGDLGSYDPEMVGMNARMSEFNAALGLEGLQSLDCKIVRHQQIADLYTASLSGLPGVRFQYVPRTSRCTYKDYSIHISPRQFGMNSVQLAAALSRDNIDTKRYFYPPLHQQRIFRNFHGPAARPLPITEEISGGILSLPIYESLDDQTIVTIARTIARHCGEGSRPEE